MKNYRQICALISRYKRHSEKITVNRQMTENLTLSRQNDIILHFKNLRVGFRTLILLIKGESF